VWLAKVSNQNGRTLALDEIQAAKREIPLEHKKAGQVFLPGFGD
jgi:hypothetical protein